ncbi:MAG: GNAT family N-acetyltransferase [Tepidisphaeraceae bacterium]
MDDVQTGAILTRPADMFAEYSPRTARGREPTPAGLVVRPARLEDSDAMAKIAWERNGGELADYAKRFVRDLSNHPRPPDELWLTALLDGEVAGYGKAGVFTPPSDAPSNCAPGGWYLFGVTVAPQFRRRGIARELTRARLAHIARLSDRAYYFANAQNRASIDLHAQFGFTELTRDFHFPGTSFTGGVGILFQVVLRAS